MVLTKENAPSPASLGQSNGIVQFAMCSARSFAPFLVRWGLMLFEKAIMCVHSWCSAPYLRCPSITTFWEGTCGSSSWLPSRTIVPLFPAKSRFTARKPLFDIPLYKLPLDAISRTPNDQRFTSYPLPCPGLSSPVTYTLSLSRVIELADQKRAVDPMFHTKSAPKQPICYVECTGNS